MTKETLLRIPTKKGSISGGLSNDIIGEIKGYLKSGKSWRLEYLMGEIYDLLTGYRSNFGGKLQSIDFDDDGEFNNKSKNEKIRELKKCLGKVIKESENLWRQQYECDKEVYKKEVEEIRGLIRRCFRDYRQLSKKENRDLEGYYKVGYFVKVKIEGDKDPCTAKILEIDKEHNRVRIEYMKKERIGQFRHFYRKESWLDLNQSMEVKEKRQVFKNYLGYIVAGYTTSYRFEKGKKVYETEFLMPDGSTQKFPLSECDIKDKKELKRGYNMGKNGEYSEGCHVVVPLEGSGALVLGEVESISLEEPKYFIRLNKRKFCMCTQDELDKWNAIMANSKRVAICADTNA